VDQDVRAGGERHETSGAACWRRSMSDSFCDVKY
jgi:hypothetical protein